MSLPQYWQTWVLPSTINSPRPHSLPQTAKATRISSGKSLSLTSGYSSNGYASKSAKTVPLSSHQQYNLGSGVIYQLEMRLFCIYSSNIRLLQYKSALNDFRYFYQGYCIFYSKVRRLIVTPRHTLRIVCKYHSPIQSLRVGPLGRYCGAGLLKGMIADQNIRKAIPYQ